MEKIKEKIEYFKTKQAEIQAAHQSAKEQANVLISESQAKEVEIWAPTKRLIEEYKAELKAFAGITDGETTDVLDLIGLIVRISTPKSPLIIVPPGDTL